MKIHKSYSLNKIIGGFTLIELMIVTAIVAILAAIAFPSYSESVQKSRRSDAYDALLDCASAQARNFTSDTPSTYMDDPFTRDGQLCGFNGTNFLSKDGHYTLVITNPNCSRELGGTNIFSCFLITANPQPSQQGDERCASFSIDERGNRRAESSDGNDNTIECWRR